MSHKKRGTRNMSETFLPANILMPQVDSMRLKINPMIPRKTDNTGQPATDWGVATFQKSYDPYLNPWQV